MPSLLYKRKGLIGMSTIMQVVLGSGLLAVCSIWHVVCIAACVPLVQKTGHRFPPTKATFNFAIILLVAFAAIIFAHTVQIWTWAIVFAGTGALQSVTEAFYFSMVTYTTLGYGDIVLVDGFRLFGTFASITGLLTFGLSTAFLVGLMARIIPDGS